MGNDSTINGNENTVDATDAIGATGSKNTVTTGTGNKLGR